MKNFLNKYKVELLIIIFFILIRVPDLGHDVFNTDVWKWKSRSYDFGTGVFTLDFEKTLQKYHPGVTLMWLGLAGIKTYSFYNKIILGVPPVDNVITNVFLLHTIQKMFIVGVLGLLMGIIYHQLKKLFGAKYAVLAVAALSLEPFYMALSRVMHLEALMSTFMLCSFIFLFRYFQDKKLKYLLFSAFFASLAFLTKTSGLFLLPFTLLVLFLENRKTHTKFSAVVKKTTITFSMWLLIAIAGFVLLWPVMYVNPKIALDALYKGIFTIGVEREHQQLYLNKLVEDPGPFFYPVVLLFKMSVLTLFGVFGFLAKAKILSNSDKKKQFLLSCGIFIAFYTIELTIPSKKLDRYILPTIMMLVLISSFYYEWLYDKIKSKFKLGPAIFISSVALFYVVTLVPLHPNYFSYYTPLLGGLKTGIYTLEPKWMLGQKEIVDHFSNKELYGSYELFKPDESLDALLNKKEIRNKLTIGFQEKYYTQIWPFITELGGRATIKDLTPQAVKTRFFVYPVYDDDSALEDRFKIEYYATIKVRGVDLYVVYRRATD